MIIKSNKIYLNPSVSKLYKLAIGRNDNIEISDTGAMMTYSGNKTGRSPKHKRIVDNEASRDVLWDDINIPIPQYGFDLAKQQAITHLQTEEIYIIDAYASWHNNYRLNVRTYCSNPYHALFIRNMLIPSDDIDFTPDFIIYNAGNFDHEVTEFYEDKTLIAMDLLNRELVIFGTMYAGEMKKGILTYFMYSMPLIDCLPLHSSANIDNDGNVTLFFGLSGTGKTSLSTDSIRQLIGDDEHVWTDDGIFNIEGGCYAKCIGLDPEKEPEIYEAIKYGAVMENVRYDPITFKVDFNDTSITKNTRCAYPLNHIRNVHIPASTNNHPNNIILLTCDAFGVLPPVAKLTHEEAVFFFVNGYTSKIPGTEQGITEPIASFSSCFAKPFIVFKPTVYGQLLAEKLEKHNPDVWLVNTGWQGGEYGVGQRINIKYSRAMIDSIHDGSLSKEQYKIFPYFGFKIPLKCNNVPDEILDPSNSWTNKQKYHKMLQMLYLDFNKNYDKITN